MVWWLNSSRIKNCKSTESFWRSIVAIYTNDSSFFDMFTAAMFILFSRKFLNMCKSKTTTCSLWQPGPPGIGILWKWAIMLTKLAEDGVCRLCSMRLEISLQMKFIIFQGFPTKLHFYLGSLLHIISFLFSYFRSWDYPEHFGIYSQLDRKVKPGFSFSSMCMFPELNETKS